MGPLPPLYHFSSWHHCSSLSAPSCPQHGWYPPTQYPGHPLSESLRFFYGGQGKRGRQKCHRGLYKVRIKSSKNPKCLLLSLNKSLATLRSEIESQSNLPHYEQKIPDIFLLVSWVLFIVGYKVRLRQRLWQTPALLGTVMESCRKTNWKSRLMQLHTETKKKQEHV